MLLTPRRLFILLGLIAAVSIIAFRGQSLWLERSNLLQQRQTQTTTLAQFGATYAARLYDQSAHVTDEISDYLREAHPDPEKLSAYLAARAKDTSIDDYMVVLDKTGHVIATSEPTTSTITNFAGPDFDTRLKGGMRQIVPMQRSRLTGAIVYPLSSAYEDPSGTVAGVIGVNVRPEGIRPPSSRRPEDPNLSIWDLDGNFVAGTFVTFNSAGKAVPPSKPPGLGIAGSDTQKDSQVLAATAPVQGWPLLVVASYDKAGVLTAWRQDVYENAALILIVLTGIGVLVWFGIKTADRETAAKDAYQKASAAADAALKDRDLLMQEVHHRVKNSLLMTASLIHLQERQFTDPKVKEAFESTRRRLKSIGLVHEALYSGSSLDEVELEGYLSRLVREICDSHGADARGVTVSVDVEPLTLAPRQTTPVGLIVAEVVTNAFKHAFGANGSGSIVVRARLVNRDEIEIEVRDDGAGYSDPEAGTGGLGSRLIRALSDQLGGILSLSNEGGAAFRITFPKLGRPTPLI